MLPGYDGVIVRDGYAGYGHLTSALHTWCGVHLLRDLKGLYDFEPAQQEWASQMAALLIEARDAAAAFDRKSFFIRSSRFSHSSSRSRAGRPDLPRMDRAAQRRRTMSQCQRMIVSGVTSNRSHRRRTLGITLNRVASSARSAQVSFGRRA